MGKAHRGGDLIYILPAGSTAVVYIYSQVLRVNIYFHIFGFGENRYRCRGGMNPARGLGGRYPLHPVYSPFIFEPAESPRPFHLEDDFLKTTAGRLARS